MYPRNVWIRRKIEYHGLHIFNGKLCTLFMYGMFGLTEKLNVHNCINWVGNCIRNMYGMSGFVENLNIQNCENSTVNCVHYTCTECLYLQKNCITRTVKIQLEIVYIIYVWNVWICKKIKYAKLRKFNRKLCIARTAKIQLEIVYIIYVQNVWICRKIEYAELRKFNKKLCTLYALNV